MNGLAHTISQLVHHGQAPDVVAMTGDLADKGQESDYQEVHRWLHHGLRPALPPQFPNSHILMVPGNHDVDRHAIKTAAGSMQAFLLRATSQAAIAEVMTDPDERAVLLKRHEAYLRFVNANRDTESPLTVPWWSETLDIRGFRVHFVGLCSSWMSHGDQDHGKLLIGRWQTNAVLNGTTTADARVVLVHHPWSFLAEFDASEIEQTIHQKCDILLRGHLHRQQSRVLHDPDNACLELAAGSAYDGSRYSNAFQLIELNPHTQAVRVHYRVWDKGQWIPDRNAYQAAPDAAATFSLTGSVTGAGIEVPDRQANPARYLQHLKDRVSHIDIRGLQVGSGKAQSFPIDQLYIPLTTTDAQRTPTPNEQSSRQENPPDRIELNRALEHRRLVIVGDPGTGKTTFLHHIALSLCRHWLENSADCDNLLPGPKESLPVLIRVASLAEHIRVAKSHNDAPTTHQTPAWLVHFVAAECKERGLSLDESFFQNQLCQGTATILIDGLDEAPTRQDRQTVAAIVNDAAMAYKDCRFIVTSRPAAYCGRTVLSDFQQVQISPLEDASIETFLDHWCRALFPNRHTEAQRHLTALLSALQSRSDIRRLARIPVMLTALAVVHWNEKRLPEQRTDLYESIMTWLARSREQRPDRPSPEQCVALHGNLALAMQVHPRGRQVQVPRYWAAKEIAPHSPVWRQIEDHDEQVAAADAFLQADEMDSGIVVARGDHIRFWHLTFQEYLAARALAARENPRKQLLASTDIYKPEWRQVILLLAGVLANQDIERVDSMFSAILDQLASDARLADQAQCVGLLGSAIQDLAAIGYQPVDRRYQQTLEAVMDIFDTKKSATVPVDQAITAAEALGQSGDPRFAESNQGSHWVAIEAGSFFMGAQKGTHTQPNFDTEAHSDESPVYRVTLGAYTIGRYPVTVYQYQRFIDSGCYHDDRFWQMGGFGQQQMPKDWDEQKRHPTRPVVGVSWFEASAYAAWAGCRLLTEAEWERAAKGADDRKYPWGDDAPNDKLLNYNMNVRQPTPVGIYPQGATPDGIVDMAGNVWEWCNDWYDKYPTDQTTDPKGPTDGKSRVLRGGSWSRDAALCRSTCRIYGTPDLRHLLIGFRVSM